MGLASASLPSIRTNQKNGLKKRVANMSLLEMVEREYSLRRAPAATLALAL